MATSTSSTCWCSIFRQYQPCQDSFYILHLLWCLVLSLRISVAFFLCTINESIKGATSLRRYGITFDATSMSTTCWSSIFRLHQPIFAGVVLFSLIHNNKIHGISQSSIIIPITYCKLKQHANPVKPNLTQFWTSQKYVSEKNWLN